MTKQFVLEPDEIKKVAKLARLALSDEEVEAATKDVSNILQHFSTIQQIDTKGVVAADEERQTKNVAREDIRKPEILASTQALVDNMPHTAKGQLKVSAVFEAQE